MEKVNIKGVPIPADGGTQTACDDRFIGLDEVHELLARALRRQEATTRCIAELRKLLGIPSKE